MTMRTSSHHYTPRELLARAKAHLAKGDLVRASARGWEAAGRLVEAAAEGRGWPHDDHGDLHVAITRLSEEAGDEQLLRLFACASGLHTNFHEGWLTRQEVETGLNEVTELVETLDALVA